MIVEAVLIGLVSVFFIGIVYTMTNIPFRTSWDLMNQTMFSTITNSTQYQRSMVPMNTILASYGIVLIIAVLGTILFVYLQSTKREIQEFAL